MKIDLGGKTALVTGASRGIGEAIARGLGAAGAHVLVAARSKDRVEQVAKEIGNATGVELDIFEGLTTCTTTASGSGAELLRDIMAAPLVRCDQVQFSFLGISMAAWNAILSLGGALAILLLNRRPR